ncbi:hypothetical protein QTO34_000805 [Cnephaeus nilssonii]|uniref:Uncharacterized protein n=1 Tax=Cnephaeus nilssonii TaxID=3371016 RepID=A0AA40ICB0_CNENI|nr:hypothetical protein QTO34_000805 [Eptesicus nilssonii]
MKDVFFCLRLVPSSQPLFAFERENPTTGAKEQFTWTRLPQGFKNSPTLFSGALASDLSKFPGQDLGCVLLQYVDDLLLASSTQAQCWEGTRALLRLLTETGYRVSKKKAQICFRITQGKRRLGTERKQAVCAIPVPSTWRQIWESLGAAGFCQIWIPGLRGEDKASIDWGPKQEKAFITRKAKLTEALALGLPDGSPRSSNTGVLTLAKTSSLSLQAIDPVASRWPPCLRALEATAVLIKEVDKLTLGQNLNVKVPHAAVTLMEARGQHWLTHAPMTQYQGLLCENPWVRLEAVRTHNPATFLPITEGAPEHDCLEVLEEVYSSWPDLRDRPLQNAHLALPEGESAQRAELWALVRALELSKNKRANIYTDSCYAFATLHDHGAIYKERGLLTAGGKGIKNQNEILKLLEAVWEPKEIAVIHCKGKDSVSEGNQHSDAAAKLAAKEQAAPAQIMWAPELSEPPKYTPQEGKWAQKEGGKRTMEGWWILPDQRVYVPEQLAHKVVLQQHELSHLGKAALETLLGRYYLIARLPSLCASVSQSCLLFAQNNAKQGPVGPIGVQCCGQAPFEDLEVDFTEIGPSRGNKYL